MASWLPEGATHFMHGCPAWLRLGAGTMNPATFLRVLGPEKWSVCYVEPSVRPDDSRYGENPNRLQQHTQFQVSVTQHSLCLRHLKIVEQGRQHLEQAMVPVLGSKVAIAAEMKPSSCSFDSKLCAGP